MSSIYSGIKKVNPVGQTNKSNSTHTPPKQHSHTPPAKKPEKKKDKDSLVDIYAEESDSSNFQHSIKNIIGMNPKGSAAEQILLGKFLGSDQGSYARNVLGKNHKGWIEHITTWLKKNQPRLEKEFNELDFSDLTSLAYDMYENYLAKQGQLEETNLPPRAAFNKKPKQKGSGYSKDDYEYTEFVPKGKEDKEAWAIKRTVAKQKLEKPKPKSMDTGFYKNYLSNRPVREGEVAPLYPLVKVDELSKDTINNYLSKSSAAVRGGKQEKPKKVPSWKVAAGKLYPDKAMGKYAKVPASGIMQGVTEGDVVSLHDEQKLLSRLIRDWWHGNEKQHAKATMMFDKMGYEPYEDGDEIVLAKGDDEVRFHMNDIIEGYSAGASGGAGLGEEVDEGQIYSTGGGPGQGYHWYKPTPAGLKEADIDKKYESAVMKGLQSEETSTDKQLRRQKRSQEIDAQIQKAYPYLVRNAKTGLEKEFMSMDDAIAFAKKESAISLDSATVVYDRNSKFPVTAYRGSEEVYAKPNVHEGDVVRGPNKWFIRNPNKAGRIDVNYPDVDPSTDNNLLPYVKKPQKSQPSNVSQLPPVPQFKLLDLYKQFTTSPQYRKGYHKGMSDDEFETMASEFIEQKLGTVKPAILGQYTEKFLQLHKTVQDTHKSLKEYGEVDTKRIIKFSKENPPDLDYLYQQFIQKMLSPDNNLDPNDWIKKVNEFYGLNYNWKDYQKRGHNDHTNNWQKIINKYILKK